MTARRAPSTPPRLPGYEHVRVLGLGGFADVFLYRQLLPRRDVAVKVLLAGSLDDDVRERFQTEANLMAQLSHHPSIVTIHQAAIADDGRPYLVMEYCSRPGLADRYRVERLSVAEVLRVGVRLASAVETAHRAGILHRDIKPANVLTTDFGWPALTDFGIAATTGPGAGAATGMSIPWSPPELLAEPPAGDVRSDVYSLAATIYSLLAGRTPFEVPGGANSAQQLVARIERAPVPPIGRDDVPAALHAVLDRAMAKNPSRRYPSAVAVARALQEVEASLHLPVTALDLPDEGLREAVDAGPSAAPDPDDATRVRSVLQLDPGPAPAPAPVDPDDGVTRRRPVLTFEPAPVPGVAVPTGEPEAPPARRRVAAVASTVVVLAVVAVLLVVTLGGRGTPGPGPASTEFTSPPQEPVAAAVPAPVGIRGTRLADGSVEVTWQNPDPQEGDAYLWGILTATGEPELVLVDEPRAVVPAQQAGEEVCVQVSIVRADRSSSARPAQGCVP